MTMKVILRQDVPNLGESGDVKQVAPGYYRNFLFPKGLAVEASHAHMSNLEASSSVKARQLAKGRSRSETLAEKIGGINLRMPVRVGDQGRIHGSVTNKDIAEALDQQAALSVDRHKIELAEPLRSIGPHSVAVKLEHGVTATLKLDLVPEEETEQ